MSGTLDSDEAMADRVRACLEDRFGADVADTSELAKMGGHASLRVYWRVELPTDDGAPAWELHDDRDESTLVAMVLAPDYDPHGSEEGPDDEEVDARDLPFVEVRDYLDELDVPVPALEHVDRDSDVLLLEDLGDRTFEAAWRGSQSEASGQSHEQRVRSAHLYREALELLVDAQRAFLDDRDEHGDDVDERCLCWRREFDRETLRWELDHYLEWGLDARRPDPVGEAAREALADQFDALTDELLALDRTVAFRDFQSRNLMHKPERDRQRPWVVIDFQDALVGPWVYDVVALLRDSYIELENDVADRLLDVYVDAGDRADLPWCDDASAVQRAFDLQTVQRKLKDAGRFVYIDRQKGDPSYLDYYDRSVGYVDRALDRLDDWDELRELLHDLDPSLPTRNT